MLVKCESVFNEMKLDRSMVVICRGEPEIAAEITKILESLTDASKTLGFVSTNWMFHLMSQQTYEK